MKTFLKNICVLVNNAILCLRFPFLYPRNRFTDLHYTDWDLYDATHKTLQASKTSYIVHIVNGKDADSVRTTIASMKIWCKKIDDHRFEVKCKGNKSHIIDISEYTDAPIDYIRYGIQNDNDDNMFKIYVILDDLDKEQIIIANYISGSFITNKYLYIASKIFKFIHKWIIQALYFFPMYTELDDMPIGWRKHFGIAMCKDLRKALVKDKKLFKYRITQIKEKYGELRWYDNYSSPRVSEIKEKYALKSYYTCKECGAPAYGMVNAGWISPYCKEHLANSSYTKFDDETVRKFY